MIDVHTFRICKLLLSVIWIAYHRTFPNGPSELQVIAKDLRLAVSFLNTYPTVREITRFSAFTQEGKTLLANYSSPPKPHRTLPPV